MKRISAAIGATLLTLTLAGCPAGGSITTDYDHSTHLNQFKTFSFGRIDTENPLNEQRVRDAVTRDLQSKGLQLAQGDGDLVVTAVGASKDKQEYQTFYNNPGFGYYYGGFGPGFGPGYSNTRVVRYRVGTLVLDFYNHSNKQLVFRGIAKRSLSENASNNTSHLNDAIDAMINRYPVS